MALKHFTSVRDIEDLEQIVRLALQMKAKPFDHETLGHHKTLGMIFLNPSLRTRLSTERAARNLGMEVMSMNFTSDGWGLEQGSGVIMNDKAGEHIKEAAPVIGQFCELIGIRSFPKLENKELDYSDAVLNDFILYANRPILSLESATLHPLQSFADLLTIEELKPKKRPKVVLTWAPHIKSLPQAVPNSFSEWMNFADVDFMITHPEGYELDPKYVGRAEVEYDQDKALKGADFVYVKNWSSYFDYGKTLTQDSSWMITPEKMALTKNGKLMHCLPVRRNLVVSEEVLDSKQSVVVHQAGNRLWAAQAIIKELLETWYGSAASR